MNFFGNKNVNYFHVAHYLADDLIRAKSYFAKAEFDYLYDFIVSAGK